MQTFSVPYLERFTMLRVTLCALVGLIGWALALSVIGVLRYSPVDIAGATILATVVAVGVNHVLARALRATTDVQSTAITALLLVLIVPIGLRDHAVFLVAASAAAAASKYLVAVDKQHLFNPAAVALVALELLVPDLTPSWWVGTAVMVPGVLACGVLVMIRARRVGVVMTFLGASAIFASAAQIGDRLSVSTIVDAWLLLVMHTALLFFGFFMMTDPVTLPSGRLMTPASVVFVAMLYATPDLRFLPFGLAPEQALCIGNGVAFVVRPKYRLALRLQSREKVGSDIWTFRFRAPERLAFSPGQFMEWTLPHRGPDGRGQRRHFTIASSPSEQDVAIVTRAPDASSTYKRALVNADGDTLIVAARLAGDFTLPRDLNKPLAFIAGGVGVAPFRSMVQFILDNEIKCDIVLVYANRCARDILFQDTFDRAARLGVRVVYTLTDTETIPSGWTGRLGRITAKLIESEVPDFPKRTFYLSGSPRMVRTIGRELSGLRVRRSRIRKDYFDGCEDP